MLKKAITAGKWTLNKPLIHKIQETTKQAGGTIPPACFVLLYLLFFI